MTMGRALVVSSSNRYSASARRTKIPITAATPATTEAIIARRRKYSAMSGSASRRESHTR